MQRGLVFRGCLALALVLLSSSVVTAEPKAAAISGESISGISSNQDSASLPANVQQDLNPPRHFGRTNVEDHWQVITRETDGQLVEQGICGADRCRSLWNRSPGQGLQARAVRALDGRLRNPGQTRPGTLDLSWSPPDLPGKRAEFLSIQRYEILLIQNSQYRIFVVDQLVPFGPARKNTGIDQDSTENPPGNGRPFALPAKAPRRVRQSFHLAEIEDAEVEIRVRAIYTNNAGASQQLSSNPQSPSEDDEDGELMLKAGDSVYVGQIIFSDPALKECVIKQSPQGEWTLISDVQALRCHGSGINYLRGLNELYALKELALQNNPIDSAKFFFDLPELQILNISQTGISDLSHLRNLSELRHLNVSGTAVKQLDALAVLENLEVLYAEKTQISGIPDLSATALTSIWLRDSAVEDLWGLAGIETLQFIDLSIEVYSIPPVPEPPGRNKLLHSFGDIYPLIQQAFEYPGILEVVDLQGRQGLNCAQLDSLETLINSEHDEVVPPGLLRPDSCNDIGIPSHLDTTANPSVGTEFSINWTTTDTPVTGMFFELEESSTQDGVPIEGQVDIHIVEATNFEFDPDEIRGAGTYRYRVRTCYADEQHSECGGWSTALHQTVMGDPGLPGEVALEQVSDEYLAFCLTEHLLYNDNGEAQWRLSGEITSLSCPGGNIVSLTGISAFPNLTILNLRSNQINNLEPLVNLLYGHQYNSRTIRLDLHQNQLSGDQLQYLTANPVEISYLDLSFNPLVDIGDLGGLMPIGHLYLDSAEINNLSPLISVEVEQLSLVGNAVVAIPQIEGLRKLDASHNELTDVTGLLASSGSLETLILNSNASLFEPNGSSSGQLEAVASLQSLLTLYLDNTGVSQIPFSNHLDQLLTLSLRDNLLPENPSIGLPGSLRTLYLDGTGLKNLQALGPISELRVLHLFDTNIEDLSPLAGTILEHIRISGGDLSAPTALTPLEGLVSLQVLVLESNGVTNIDPVIALMANPDSGFNLPFVTHTRIDVLREEAIPCGQVYEVYESGLLWSEHPATPECLPEKPQDFKVALHPDQTTYSFTWLPTPVPPHYLATDRYQIETNPSNVETLIADVNQDFATLALDSLESDYYRFRIRSCRPDDECSDWSEQSYAQFPLMRPTNVTLDAAGQSVNVSWGYPDIPAADQGEIEFELKPIFPVVDPVIVPWASVPWTNQIDNIDQFPGRVVRLAACRNVGSQRYCGPSVERRLFEIETTPELSTPAELALTPVNEVDGRWRLSWSEDEVVEFYQVEERQSPRFAGGEEVIRHYAVEANSLSVKRFAATHETDFRLRACRRGQNGNAAECSDATAHTPAAQIETDVELGVVDGLCWFRYDGDDPPQIGATSGNAKARLRWQYSTVDGDAPAAFNLELQPSNSDNVDLGHKAFSDQRYISNSKQWIWETDPITFGAGVNSSNSTYTTEVFVRATLPDGRQAALGGRTAAVEWNWNTGTLDFIEESRCQGVQSREDQPDSSGGPASLLPGHWVTSKPPKSPESAGCAPSDHACRYEPSFGLSTGWRFYWSHDIPESNGADGFGISYNLIGFWQTYKLIDGIWSPVWYYSRMQTDPVSGQFAEGALMYPNNFGEDQNIGAIRVYFERDHNNDVSDFQHAWVELNLNQGSGLLSLSEDGGELTSIAFPIRDFAMDEGTFAEGGLGDDNPTDHYRGVWIPGEGPLFDEHGKILPGHDFFMVDWVVGNMLSAGIHTFDENGKPIWFLSMLCQSGANGGCINEPYDAGEYQFFSGSSDLFTVFPGHGPFHIAEDYATYHQLSEDRYLVYVDESGGGSTTQGVGRLFRTASGEVHSQHRTGLMCAELQGSLGPVSYAKRNFAISMGDAICGPTTDPTQLMAISKVANNHFIDYELTDNPGSLNCNLDASGTCAIELSWYTDDYYPTAMPMYTTGGYDGELKKLNTICENPTPEFGDEFIVRNHSCVINTDATYRFHLVSRTNSGGDIDDSSGAVIASSKALTIWGSAGTDPKPVPSIAGDPLHANVIPASNILVGTTAGNLVIDTAGSAVYSIPIMTMPGSGALAPEIALTYSSQSDRGPIGPGWSISGVSNITRCGQGVEHGDPISSGVDLSENDRFCLDGQRLVLVAGESYGGADTEYRYEIDNLTRVFARHSVSDDGLIGPLYFEVWQPDGSVATYGGASSILATVAVEGEEEEAEVVFAWPLERFQDGAGNYIEYEYLQPGAGSAGNSWIEWLIHKVSYTGNESENHSHSHEPYAKIEFVYETLPASDTLETGSETLYAAGQKLRKTQMLKSIVSCSTKSCNAKKPELTPDDILRVYHLKYKHYANHIADDNWRFLLESVKECTFDGSKSVCFNPTTFEWLAGIRKFNSEAKLGSINELNRPHSLYAADLTGSGRDDLVIAQKVNNAIRIRVFTSNENGSLVPAGGHTVDARCWEFDEPGFNLSFVDFRGLGKHSILYPASCDDNSTHIYRLDLVWASSSENWSLYDSTQEPVLPGHPNQDPDPYITIGASYDSPRMMPLDINGDGVTDLVYWDGDAENTQLYFNNVHVARGEWTATGASVSTNLTFEIPQIVQPPAQLPCLDSVTTYCYANQTLAVQHLPPFSIDGAGTTGLLLERRYLKCELNTLQEAWSDRGVLDWSTGYSNEELLGSGACENIVKHQIFKVVADANDALKLELHHELDDIMDGDRFYVGDVNGDGLQDILVSRSGTNHTELHLYKNTGVTFLAPRNVLTMPENAERYGFARLVDLRGEGRASFIVPSHTYAHGGHHAHWEAHLWIDNADGGRFSNTTWSGSNASGLNPGDLWSGDQDVFADVRGNGNPTRFVVTKSNLCDANDGNDWLLCRSHSRWGDQVGNQVARPSVAIKRIENGHGEQSNISYLPITHSNVYAKDHVPAEFGWGQGSAVYSIRSPMFVVSSVTASAPQIEPAGSGASGGSSSVSVNAQVQVDYFYAGARIQAGRRGFLGFRQVASHDRQTDLVTVQTFHQEFPFIGLLEKEVAYFVDTAPWASSVHQFPSECMFDFFTPECGPQDIPIDPAGLLKRTTNEFNFRSTDSGDFYPFIETNIVEEYMPFSCAVDSSCPTHTTITEMVGVDQYGNPAEIIATTVDPLGIELAKERSILNYDYGPNRIAFWQLGLLECSEIISLRAGREQEVTFNAFEYHPATGVLSKEYLQPDECDNKASAHLVIEHRMDDFGNRVESKQIDQTSTPNSTRKSRVGFDEMGRWVVSEDVWLMNSWVRTRRVGVLGRDRYGNPLDERDVRNNATRFHYDPMGRLHYSYQADGSWSRVVLSHDIPAWCPVGTSFTNKQTAADGSETNSCHDVLGRPTKMRERGLNDWIYQDVQYDFASRKVEVSEPYFASPLAIYWTVTKIDRMGRVSEVHHPSSTDQNERTDTYSYSHDINMNHVVERVERHFLKYDIEDDTSKAVMVVQERGLNILGDVAWAKTDADAFTEFEYDSRGRLIQTSSTGSDAMIEVQYDALGNKKWMHDSEKGEWHYRHNAFGELVCQVDSLANATYLEYDELGRKVLRQNQRNSGPVANCSKLGDSHGDLEGATRWVYENATDEGGFGYEGFGRVKEEFSTFVSNESALDFEFKRNYTYDPLGRAIRVISTVTESAPTQGPVVSEYEQRMTFDQIGRPFQQFDASSSFDFVTPCTNDSTVTCSNVGGEGQHFVYGQHGHLIEIVDARHKTAGRRWWKVEEMDERQNVVIGVLGNGMKVWREYDLATGEMTTLMDENGNVLNQVAQLQFLQWDALGRLAMRRDYTAGWNFEWFDYDKNSRLIEVRNTSYGDMWDIPDWEVSQRLRYSETGNILCKSDLVGSSSTCANGANDDNYFYENSVHAVTQAGNRSFVYDLNGNVEYDSAVSGRARNYDYTSFNSVQRVRSSDNGFSSFESTEFYYGPDRSRVLRRDVDDLGVVTRTHYIGNVEVVFEGEGSNIALIETKRYISGVALVTTSSSGLTMVRYQHRDHLGSIVALSDQTGVVIARMSFDAWGQRRAFDSPQNVWDQWLYGRPGWSNAMLGLTNRGFTGHEHIDAHGIIHMNGRIYDAHLGRFLQADPFIEDARTLNRYTYVHNNPLAWVDPSGYTGARSNRRDGRSAQGKARVALVFAAGLAIYYPVLLTEYGAAYAFTTGAIAGYGATGTVKGAFQGGLISLAFVGLGQISNDIMNHLAYGAASGVYNRYSGGSFRAGFASALITRGISGAVSGIGNEGVGTIVSAVVGGTSSQLAGGNFANGAVTAVMAYESNQRQRGRNRPINALTTPEQRAEIENRLEALNAELTEINMQGGFVSPDAAAAWLHHNVHPLGIEYDTEIGARIFRNLIADQDKVLVNRYFVGNIVTQHYSNRVNIGISTFGRGLTIISEWHTHGFSNAGHTIGVDTDWADKSSSRSSYVSRGPGYGRGEVSLDVWRSGSATTICGVTCEF